MLVLASHEPQRSPSFIEPAGSTNYNKISLAILWLKWDKYTPKFADLRNLNIGCRKLHVGNTHATTPCPEKQNTQKSKKPRARNETLKHAIERNTHAARNGSFLEGRAACARRAVRDGLAAGAFEHSSRAKPTIKYEGGGWAPKPSG